MSFVDIPGGGATVPEHNRLRGLDRGDPHTQYLLRSEAEADYAQAGHTHARFLELFGASGGLSGSAPTASSGGFLIQAAAGPVTTDAGGLVTIEFPEAFPTGLLVCVCTVAHEGNNILMSPTAGGGSVSECEFSAMQADTAGAIVSSTFGVQWVAIGW